MFDLLGYVIEFVLGCFNIDVFSFSFLLGLLYAVGGHDGSDHLHSGEVFDPKTNSWTPIAHMATLRSVFSYVKYSSNNAEGK